MRTYVLTHLSDDVLLRELDALVAQERAANAVVLAHLAEVDSRRLFVPAGFASMYAYCVGELRFSEDMAWKRIQAARAARQHPAIFDCLADGRLHLSAVSLLAPHLTRANARELLAAAAHRTKSDIETLLAEWFPRTESLPWVQEIRPAAAPQCVVERVGADGVSPGVPAPGQVGSVGGGAVPEPDEFDGEHSSASDLVVWREGAPWNPPGRLDSGGDDTRGAREPAPGQVGSNGAGHGAAAGPVGAGRAGYVPPAAPASKITPNAAGRFAVQLNVSQATYDKMKHAEALLSHVLPGGDIAEILDRALDALITQLEKRKFAATPNPRPQSPSPSTNARYIPAHIRRAVWQRDGSQCTFVSETGHRCEMRKWLEFDHVDPVAFGGKATVEGIRLRCHAHNQYEAERTFGARFMEQRREESRRGRSAEGDAARGADSPTCPGAG